MHLVKSMQILCFFTFLFCESLAAKNFDREVLQEEGRSVQRRRQNKPSYLGFNQGNGYYVNRFVRDRNNDHGSNNQPLDWLSSYSNYGQNSAVDIYDRQDLAITEKPAEKDEAEDTDGTGIGSLAWIQLTALATFTFKITILFSQMLLGLLDPPNIPWINSKWQFFTIPIPLGRRSFDSSSPDGNVSTLTLDSLWSIDFVDAAFDVLDIKSEPCRKRAICKLYQLSKYVVPIKWILEVLSKEIGNFSAYEEAMDAAADIGDCELVYSECNSPNKQKS